MKRFIIISLLSALTLSTPACMWIDNHNPYLYKIYDYKDFKDRVETICNDNWKAYLGSTEEYFWFNADDVIKAAQQKGDALMVSYVQNLNKYLACVDVERKKQYEWDYPSKEEIDQCQRDLQAIRTYALGKSKSKLRSQHALLYMRCNMMLGRHQENITFWEQTASQFIETVYKDMMKNIYAGALYKTGHEMEAAEMFAEMGDYSSLMTQFYKKRSYMAIRQHYKQNPNSKALPFLLQDFVNNSQEAIDAQNESFGGKLFIRDITKEEAWQMCNFCEEVLREGKTENPIMWKSAKAWIKFLFGEPKEAVKDIMDAARLNGTDRMKECTRELMLYITADQAKEGEAFDDYLADELDWLMKREDYQSTKVVDRLTHKILIKRYANRPEQMIALLKTTISPCYYEYIDTMRVEGLEKYLFYTNTPGKSNLDKFLKHNLNENDTVLSELIGTKYMRLCQWDKAIQWLKDIPVSFYNEHRSREYLYYSLLRRYDIEPWMQRQWLKSDDAWERNVKWWKQLKLDFCKEMQMMEGSLNLLKGKAYDQRCYNLAAHYAQASVHGDCWWLLHNAKSCWDDFRVNEVNLDQRAIQMLQKAAMSSDPALKRKALFGLGYRELYGVKPYGERNTDLWRESVWDSNLAEYVDQYNPTGGQYRAFQALYDLVGEQPQEDYIRKCDEYNVFKNYYREHKK